jgi:hypothetical protein
MKREADIAWGCIPSHPSHLDQRTLGPVAAGPDFGGRDYSPALQ